MSEPERPEESTAGRLRERLERLGRLSSDGKRAGQVFPHLSVSGLLATMAGLCALLGLVSLVARSHPSEIVPGFLSCAGVAFGAACMANRRDRARLRLTLLVGLEIALAIAVCLLFLALLPT